LSKYSPGYKKIVSVKAVNRGSFLNV